MTVTARFAKYRELLTLARTLHAEADRMPLECQGKWDRRIAATEYRLKAEWMSGRLTDDEYAAEVRECLDAALDPL